MCKVNDRPCHQQTLPLIFSKWFKPHCNVMRKKWRKFLFLEMKWCLVSPIRASITSLKVNLAKSGSPFSMYCTGWHKKISHYIKWRNYHQEIAELENLLGFQNHFACEAIILTRYLFGLAWIKMQQIKDSPKSEKIILLLFY